VYLPPNKYIESDKLPTTYEKDEIKRIITSVERSSKVGKRDYLVLLLAAEYGWRSKDIIDFSFDSIDWENNVIRFYQHKTNNPVEYPLLSTVGNAIIDYLKYARPKSEMPNVILALTGNSKGKPLAKSTIHGIVSKYLQQANIADWKDKKHGPHALRHSLASNLLKNDIPLPVISAVLGHQNTETTKKYISIDYEQLKKCALPMPILQSPYYGKGGII
jgi:integrase